VAGSVLLVTRSRAGNVRGTSPGGLGSREDR